MKEKFASVATALLAVAAIGAPTVASAADDKPRILDAMARRVPLNIKAHYDSNGKWVPLFQFGVAFDGVEDDDVLLVQHYKGHGKRAKKWGKPQTCTDPSNTRLKRSFAQKIHMFRCKGDKAMANPKGGKYSARVTYRQTGAGVDHKDIKTIEYSVKKYANDASGAKKNMAFVADLDHRIGEAWISLHGDGAKFARKVKFSIWLKWEEHGEPNGVLMRCYLKGKKVAGFKSHNRYDVKVDDYKNGKNKPPSKTRWGKYVFYADRNGFVEAHPTKEGRKPRDEAFYFAKNPGDYRCTVTHKGSMIREVLFTVGDDGAIKQAGCVGQTVHAANQHYLVKVKIKPGLDPKYDKKAFGKKSWFGVGSSACKL